MKKITITITTLLFSILTFAQVGIGTNVPVTSSILELKAADKALLLTRVATTAAVATPVNGMMVYDISSNCIKGYQNGAWTDCLSNCAAASTSGTSFGGGGISCDTNAFINPISAGTASARAEAATSYDYHFKEEPIILDGLGKKFYIQSQNFFWDLNVNDLYSTAGMTTQSSNLVQYKFPTSYSYNTYGHWVEMKIVGQLYPTKTWKQFSTFASRRYDNPAVNSNPDYWMMLLSTDGEIKTVRYSKRNNTFSFIYPGMTGREGVGKTLAIASVGMAATDFFATTDIKAYSNVNTQTTTNWSWFEPYFSGYFSEGNLSTDFISGALAFNAADNLFYTWGAKDVVVSQTVYSAYSNILLRTTPSNITEAMTPLPATILNNLLTTLNTTVKEPSNDHSTLIISKKPLDSRPVLNFIANNNKVIRYNLNNNFYTSLSMPAGVNPISIQRNDATSYVADNIYILGSDGKLYSTTSIATAANQTGTITAFADPVFANATYRKIKQYTNGRFIDENGQLGTFLNGGSTINTFSLKQTIPIKRILYSWWTGLTNHSCFFINTNNNFGEYIGSGLPTYNQFGNVGGKIGNYLYNRKLNTVAPDFLDSYQFYPTKCSTY